jgi:hypothetical protein
MAMKQKPFPLVLLALSSLIFTGCAPVVALDPAQDANNVGCAEIIVRLPDELALEGKRSVNAQSTAAWGTPVSVILRCGLEPVFASTLPCVSAADIDWLVDESDAPNYRFTSFATTPATEVIIDSTKVSGITVLEELAGAVGVLEPETRCTEFAG